MLHPVDRIRREYSKATLSRMRQLHANELAALARRVHQFCDARRRSTRDEAWEHIRVSCLIIDLRGRVTQLDA